MILENLSITIRNNNYYNQKEQGFNWITGKLKGHKLLLHHLDAHQDMENEKYDTIFNNSNFKKMPKISKAVKK